MTEPDPLADVSPGTEDAPLPVPKHPPDRWGRYDWRILAPHPDDPRWHPTEETP